MSVPKISFTRTKDLGNGATYFHVKINGYWVANVRRGEGPSGKFKLYGLCPIGLEAAGYPNMKKVRPRVLARKTATARRELRAFLKLLNWKAAESNALKLARRLSA